jgi:hypothetical protein
MNRSEKSRNEATKESLLLCCYGVFSKSTNARSRSAPVLGRSNFRWPRAHGITENLQLADMAVAGDGHTPYFKTRPNSFL